jgi:hypothetical protein
MRVSVVNLDDLIVVENSPDAEAIFMFLKTCNAFVQQKYDYVKRAKIFMNLLQ